MKAINNHLKGTEPLTDAQIATHKSTIDAQIASIGSSAILISESLDVVRNYEAKYGAFFVNASTSQLERASLPVNIHTTLLSVMQGILDYTYTPQNLISNKDLLTGFRFLSSDYFPGKVTSTPTAVYTATINASYPATAGKDVMYTDWPARKPTGAYLAPGSMATVTVPSALVGKGYQIRIGAHSWDFSNKPHIRRFDRVSLLYPINSASVTVASPLGGGIYLEVPYLASAGTVAIQIQNAVRSPLFSMTRLDTTTVSEWQNIERKWGAPWADFQTDKFAVQVPTSWIYNLSDPTQGMRDWDSAMDVVSRLMGFPLVRGKEVLYLQPDVLIRGSAYFPGYPQTNSTYNPKVTYNGDVSSYHITGPRLMNNHVEFHELGHSQLFQKFPGETEAAVNLLYAAVQNRAFGMALDTAHYKALSYKNTFMTLDNTAIEWMACENFKNQKSMVSIEMQYQIKGHAKYVELARQYGWEGLDAYWRSINQDLDAGKTIDASIDGLILRMSKAYKMDVSPLIHFWGMLPIDLAANRAAIAAENLPASARIYDLLLRYQASVPANNAAFRAWALNWWGKQPSESGYTTERYHALLWNTWNEAYAASIRQIVQTILNAYFPSGRPLEGFTLCAKEGQSFTLPGICEVAYGANGKYAYKYGVTGTISFNNATFGDPNPGVFKAGYYNPNGRPQAGYTWCAKEGQSFTLPGTCDVAYGAKGKFTYKYGVTGMIAFDNATFGDPVPGVVKAGFYKIKVTPAP